MAMEVFDAPPVGARTPAPGAGPAPARPPGPVPGSVAEEWMKALPAAREGKLPSGAPLDPGRVLRLAVGLQRPESLDDYLLITAAQAPLLFAGGAGAAALAPQALKGLAPSAGRIATSALLGAGQGEGLQQAALAGVAEALPVGGRMLTHLKFPHLGKLAGPAEAIEAIRGRIGQGPDGPVNLGLFNRWLARWHAAPTEAERLVEGRAAADFLGGTGRFKETGLGDKDAATMFRTFVLGGKVSPETSARAVRATQLTPMEQAALDAVHARIPFALLAPAALLRELPGGRRVLRGLGAAEESD